jgi:hypothetical protein
MRSIRSDHEPFGRAARARHALPRALQKVLTFSYQILRHVDIDPGIF